MENINLASFLAYFGDYYPILIPSIALLLGLSAVMFDQLRVWVITYVDEGESGPYKKYVIPFLRKLFKLRGCGVGWHQEILKLNIGGEYVAHGTDVYVWKKHPVCPTKAEELKHIIDKYDLSENPSLSRHIQYGDDLEEDHKLKPEPDINILPNSIIYAAILSGGLLAYKFLPAITIGCIVGYAVMRLARSVVRLTKRFNKHCSDGHGAGNDKATQEAKVSE